MPELIFNEKVLLRLGVSLSLIFVSACSEPPAQIDGSNKQIDSESKPAKEQSITIETSAKDYQCLSERWWSNYKLNLISEDGRVIDRSDSRQITTSEGQSYALFFALLMDDKPTFDSVLKWTQNNLAQGDLANHLPAWLWGEKSINVWGIIDQNSATDSDMWIAYSLLEAGRQWQAPKYSALGELIALQIIEKETIDTQKFGLILLPGAYGFVKPNHQIKLNPSYLPPMLTHYFAINLRESRWGDIHYSSLQILQQSSTNGLAPDWWWLNDSITDSKGQAAHQKGALLSIGSYDAIRVYLWLGMLSDDYVNTLASNHSAAKELTSNSELISKDENLDKKQLINWLGGMMSLVSSTGIPPEKVDIHTGSASGKGNLSFRAALLPYVSYFNPRLAKKMALKVIAKYETVGKNAYYTQSLIGFGLGWWQGWYEFDNSGSLISNRGQCRQ